MKSLYTFLFLFLLIPNLIASPSFKLEGPNKVGINDAFRIVYVLENAEEDKINFPNLNKDFSVLQGPNVGSSTQVQVINGKMTKNSTRSFSFFLKPKKTGYYLIPGAKVSVGNKFLNSNSIKINVVKGNVAVNSSNYTSIPNIPQNIPQQSAPKEKFDPSKVFLRTELSKTDIIEGEVIVATVNLYTRYGFQGRISKVPETKGFLSEYVTADPEKESSIKMYKGVKYEVSPIYRLVLTPLKAGKFTIGSCGMQTVFTIGDPVFGQSVQKYLESTPITVNVKPSPAYKGYKSEGVGHFTLLTDLSPKDKYRQNEAITLTYKISGSGNLKLISEPKFDCPSTIDSMPVKKANDIKYSKDGEIGSRTFEYTLIPKKTGLLIIPSIEMVYYDNLSRSYKTLKSPVYRINVEKGLISKSNNISSGNITDTTDINPIAKEKYSLSKKNSFIIESVWYWILLILPIFILLSYIIYCKKFKGYFSKRINPYRCFISRINDAYKDSDVDYDILLSATYEYLSSKLDISYMNLNKETLQSYLKESHIEETTIKDLLAILEYFERAKYSQQKDVELKTNILSTLSKLIEKIEKQLN